MARLQLPESEIFEEVVQEAIDEANGPINKLVARDLFNKHGLTLDSVAHQMHKLLNFGEESTKLKVLQDLLKIHGALEEQVESKSVNINFSFSNKTGDSFEKVQILIPR